MLHVIRIASVLLLALLVGCQSHQQVKLYEGEARPTSELLIVSVPETLELMSINGQSPDGLGKRLISGDQQLQLLPGSYQLVAFYKDVWTPVGASTHEVVRSQPVIFDLQGAAGSQFALEYLLPQNYPEASALAGDFHGWSRNLASGEKQPSRASGLSRPSLFNRTAEPAAVAPLAAPAAASTAAQPAAVAAESTYLELLKAYWSQASQDERRTFLRWVAEPAPAN